MPDAPRAKKKLLADLKSSILRPALTSTYKVWFRPNGDVQDWLKAKAAAGLGNYVGRPTDDLISLSCSDANLPGSSLATHELNDEFHGVTHRHVYRRQYDTSTDFTFYVDVDYEPLFFFENWMAYTVDEQFARGLDYRTYSYRVSLPKEYLSDVYISKFERDYKGKILVYKFIGAFPTSFSSMPVSYESSQLLKCTVSMAYQRYVLKSDYFSGSDIGDVTAADLETLGQISVNENGSTVTLYDTDRKVTIGNREYTTDTSLDF